MCIRDSAYTYTYTYTYIYTYTSTYTYTYMYAYTYTYAYTYAYTYTYAYAYTYTHTCTCTCTCSILHIPRANAVSSVTSCSAGASYRPSTFRGQHVSRPIATDEQSRRRLPCTFVLRKFPVNNGLVLASSPQGPRKFGRSPRKFLVS